MRQERAEGVPGLLGRPVRVGCDEEGWITGDRIQGAGVGHIARGPASYGK